MPGQIARGGNPPLPATLRALLEHFLADESLIETHERVLVALVGKQALLRTACAEKDAEKTLKAWTARLGELSGHASPAAVRVGAALMAVSAEQSDTLLVASGRAWASHLALALNRDVPAAAAAVARASAIVVARARPHADLARDLAQTHVPKIVRGLLQQAHPGAMPPKSRPAVDAALDSLALLQRAAAGAVAPFAAQLQDTAVAWAWADSAAARAVLAGCAAAAAADGSVGPLLLRLVATADAAVTDLALLAGCNGGDALPGLPDPLTLPATGGTTAQGAIAARLEHLRSIFLALDAAVRASAAGGREMTAIPIHALLLLALRLLQMRSGAMRGDSAGVTTLKAGLPLLNRHVVRSVSRWVARFGRRGLQPFSTTLQAILECAWTESRASAANDALQTAVHALAKAMIANLGWTRPSSSLIRGLLADVPLCESTAAPTADEPLEKPGRRQDKHRGGGGVWSEPSFLEAHWAVSRRAAALDLLTTAVEHLGPWLGAPLRSQIDRTALEFVLQDEMRAATVPALPAPLAAAHRHISAAATRCRIAALGLLTASAQQPVPGQVPPLPYALAVLQRALQRERPVSEFASGALRALEPLFRPQLPALAPPVDFGHFAPDSGVSRKRKASDASLADADLESGEFAEATTQTGLDNARGQLSISTTCTLDITPVPTDSAMEPIDSFVEPSEESTETLTESLMGQLEEVKALPKVLEEPQDLPETDGAMDSVHSEESEDSIEFPELQCPDLSSDGELDQAAL